MKIVGTAPEATRGHERRPAEAKAADPKPVDDARHDLGRAFASSPRRDEALSRYMVNDWGGGYFSIDEEGFAVVRPNRKDGSWVRMADVLDELKRRGFRSPFLLRFPQLLKDRVQRLNDAFNAAIKEFD